MQRERPISRFDEDQIVQAQFGDWHFYIFAAGLAAADCGEQRKGGIGAREQVPRRENVVDRLGPRPVFVSAGRSALVDQLRWVRPVEGEPAIAGIPLPPSGAPVGAHLPMVDPSGFAALVATDLDDVEFTTAVEGVRWLWSLATSCTLAEHAERTSAEVAWAAGAQQAEHAVETTSNGVNLTDGLDGLATGASVMTFAAFILIGVWEFGQGCSVNPGPKCYEVRDPLDLAIVAAALMGACFGFLWWNASPAKIFMGDTGALALGGALAGLAITSRTQLLLALLGGLFLIITLSVIIQVSFFKITGGKRIFRMAPLHHHFELSGWGDVTIVIRFWIIAGLCVASGLGLFYGVWVVA